MPYAISSLREVQTALENDRLSMGHYRSFQEDENASANLTISCDTLAEAITCLFATASIVGACDPEHAIIDPRVQDFAREAKFALRGRASVRCAHRTSCFILLTVLQTTRFKQQCPHGHTCSRVTTVAENTIIGLFPNGAK